jgi:hypothetical protein
LTPEAIEAWSACYRKALHCALGLGPAAASPLPFEISVCGVTDDEFDSYRASIRGDGPWSRSLKKAAMLQRQLLKVAGYPREARRALEENLAEAIRDRDIARNNIINPPGTQGTGCNPEARQKRLEDCEVCVEYYTEALDELAEMQAKFPAKGSGLFARD